MRIIHIFTSLAQSFVRLYYLVHIYVLCLTVYCEFNCLYGEHISCYVSYLFGEDGVLCHQRRTWFTNPSGHVSALFIGTYNIRFPRSPPLEALLLSRSAKHKPEQKERNNIKETSRAPHKGQVPSISQHKKSKAAKKEDMYTQWSCCIHKCDGCFVLFLLFFSIYCFVYNELNLL